MIQELIVRNRSYRRFYDEPVSRQTLEQLVDCARLSASGANKQPLKYVLACERERNDAIFGTLAWAGYLPQWPGPVEAERPTAYIIVVADKEIGPAGIDHGIAVQSLLLAAVEKGLGGCILASVQRDKLASLLKLPPRYEILLVLALGKPKEQVQLEELPSDGSVKYWRDEQQVHHVPKRTLRDSILDL
ncbi:MAG: nitroreductase family protein [Sporomusaceae bacterium]|nr:nitroreductase family protein [Sporomusaceae bacterium]